MKVTSLFFWFYVCHNIKLTGLSQYFKKRGSSFLIELNSSLVFIKHHKRSIIYSVLLFTIFCLHFSIFETVYSSLRSMISWENIIILPLPEFNSLMLTFSALPSTLFLQTNSIYSTIIRLWKHTHIATIILHKYIKFLAYDSSYQLSTVTYQLVAQFAWMCCRFHNVLHTSRLHEYGCNSGMDACWLNAF